MRRITENKTKKLNIAKLFHLDERREKVVTWEIGDKDDLSLVVQTALDLLELGPPR